MEAPSLDEMVDRFVDEKYSPYVAHREIHEHRKELISTIVRAMDQGAPDDYAIEAFKVLSTMVDRINAEVANMRTSLKERIRAILITPPTRK